ncbi:unnamed protein product, partial [Rotaria magnacalcarata]
MPRHSKKASKDPNAPKRPLSGYFLFARDERLKIKSTQPNIPMTDFHSIFLFFMDESFFKISFPSDSGLCETNDFVHSSIFPSLYSSLVNEKISNINNELENNCFFPDDYKCSKLSTMIRWQSNAENLNVNSNSSNQEIPIAESYLPDDFFIKKTVPSASVLDDLISPMSRLSTSSSVMSFNSLGNYKVPQQLP